VTKTTLNSLVVTSHNEFKTKRFFKRLDGIRGLAILAVVWHHSLGLNPSTNPIFTRGYLGVDLFFVLSGFLITTLLLREYERNGTISLKEFYIRRTLRIFPVYYAFLLMLLIWYGLTDKDTFNTYLEVFPYYALYLTNWLSSDTSQIFERGWSLAVEEQFYLFWPGLLLILGAYRTKVSITLLVMVSIILTISMDDGAFGYWLKHFIPFRTIFVGALLAFTLHNINSFSNFFIVLTHRFTAPILIVLIILMLSMASSAINGGIELVLHIMFALLIGTIVINENSYTAIIIGNRLFSIIGIVSYGIYIFHGQLQGISRYLVGFLPFNDTKVIFFTVFTVISTVVALISFYTFEQYFLKLKKKY